MLGCISRVNRRCEWLRQPSLKVLEKEEGNNELRRKLGELIRLVEQFQDSVPEQLSDEVLLLIVSSLLYCCYSSAETISPMAGGCRGFQQNSGGTC